MSYNVSRLSTYGSVQKCFISLSNIVSLPSHRHKMKPILNLHHIFVRKMETSLMNLDVCIYTKSETLYEIENVGKETQR